MPIPYSEIIGSLGDVASEIAERRDLLALRAKNPNENINSSKISVVSHMVACIIGAPNDQQCHVIVRYGDLRLVDRKIEVPCNDMLAALDDTLVILEQTAKDLAEYQQHLNDRKTHPVQLLVKEGDMSEVSDALETLSKSPESSQT